MNTRGIAFAFLAVSLPILAAFSSSQPRALNTTATVAVSNAAIVLPPVVATNIPPGNGDFTFSISLDGRRSQAQRNEEFLFASERVPLLALKSGYQTIIIDQKNNHN